MNSNFIKITIHFYIIEPIYIMSQNCKIQLKKKELMKKKFSSLRISFLNQKEKYILKILKVQK